MSDYLFDGDLLKNLDVVPNDSNLLLRPLSLEDYNKDFLNVLQELTDVGEITEISFLEKFNSMKACKGSYYIIVLENLNNNKIVASATLVVEQKFIHKCSSRGRIEDVVVSSNYRKKNIGRLLVSTLIQLSKSVGCYKVTLECKVELVSFYESLGLKKEVNNSNYLQKRF